MILESWTLVQPDIELQRQIDEKSICFFTARSFAKGLGLFSFYKKEKTKMYFTNTPSLSSMEAIMKQPPGYRQQGGGTKRKPYQYTKADCSCRLCPTIRGKKAVPFPFVRCWTSGWNAAPLLWKKPFNPRSVRWHIHHSNNGFKEYTKKSEVVNGCPTRTACIKKFSKLKILNFVVRTTNPLRCCTY